MGYAYYQLVPAAIMYDNPGCTKEELTELFLQTNLRTGEIPLYRLEDEVWRHELKQVKKDTAPKLEYGLVFTQNPYRERTPKEKRAFISEHNLTRWDNSNNSGFKEDGRAEHVHSGIFGLARILNLDKNGYYYQIDFRYNKDFLKTRKVKAIFNNYSGTEIFFPDVESMTTHRNFNPNKLFDFSKESGSFDELDSVAHIFRWTQKNGKYYFDFERMKDNIDTFGFVESMNRYLEPCSYTDFIVTLEAVRKKAWKMLSYRGLQHRENFFKKNPDFMPKYQRAVWDSFTSLDAKTRKLTYFEMMRLRLESRIKD